MAGVDIRTVQELMGHKSIVMTMRYSHLSDVHKREAINRLVRGEKQLFSYPNRDLNRDQQGAPSDEIRVSR